MDPHIFIARAEGQRWLTIAEKLLISQDLVGSKTFAIRARESDPRLEAADQILAIIDTLLAAEKRIIIGNTTTNQPDYYAILQLVQNTNHHITAQYRQLAFLLNPNHNRFPYSEQAFHLVNDAYSVLSDPVRKSIYDSNIQYIDMSQHSQHYHDNNNNNNNNNNHNNNNIGFNLDLQQQSQNHLHQHNFFDPPQEMFQQQQHNFMFQNSVGGIPGVPVRDHGEMFNVHPFHITSTRPLTSADPPPMSWPQQMHQQQQQQEVNRVDRAERENGVEEEDVEIVKEMNDGENVEDVEDEDDESPTFWTTCPYCLNMYEHYKAYVDCILRCENCKRAFQAVPIPAPPDVAEDQETYFCCWGYYPIGVSMAQLGKKVGEENGNWTPFSTLNDVSSQVKGRSNAKESLNDKECVNDDEAVKKAKLWEPFVYIDDITDNIFDGISEEESSDDSDDDDYGSRNRKKKKSKKIKRDVGYIKKERFMVSGRNGKNAENSIPVSEEPIRHEGAESSKKAVTGNPRRQSGRVANNLGKLDLNVEFNNNEGEEPVLRTAVGNRGNGEGAEDNVEEGIGFFEGLDEFLSNLPILSVNDEENVKDS